MPEISNISENLISKLSSFVHSIYPRINEMFEKGVSIWLDHFINIMYSIPTYQLNIDDEKFTENLL